MAPPQQRAGRLTIALAAALALQATHLTVSSSGSQPTVAGALAAARAGDTVRVTAGVYHEHITIDRPVILVGEPGATLTGDGRGVVITVRARARISGLTIRGSGTDQSHEDAAILALAADSLVVEHNRLTDVLFGIYVKQGSAPVIRSNDIEGKDLPLPLRGDGIRLWYTHGGVIADNHVRRSRDIVIWFADHTLIEGNRVSDGRYGLHFMYSHHNRFDHNVFDRNDVGAFVMYSGDITFRDNVFAGARGPGGRGLGFKDVDSVRAARNVFVKNAVGISIDNSPHLEGVTNDFQGNILAYNDVGVSILPAVHDNVFRDNQFLGNGQPVGVSGGGTALANRWAANYWSDYAGFDADGDGFGDTPFVYDRLSDDLVARHPALQLFSGSLAVTAINTLSRVLPLLSPEPIVVDSLPRRNAALPPAAVAGTSRPAAALAMVGLLALSAVAVLPWRRGRKEAA